MKRRNSLIPLLSLSAIALIFALAGLAWAQETPPEPAPAESSAPEEPAAAEAPAPEAPAVVEAPVRPRPPRPLRPTPPRRVGAPESAPAEGGVTRLIPVRHADMDNLMSVLQPFYEDGLSVSMSEEMGIITVVGTAESVQRFEEAVRSLDKPEKNIELTVFVVRGSYQTQAAPPMPERLQPLVERLRQTFPFTTYTPVDTMVLRTRSGDEVGASDIVMLNPDTRLNQRVQGRLSLIEDDSSRTIRIDDLTYQVGVTVTPPPAPEGAPSPSPRPVRPMPSHQNEIYFSADLDVPAGEGALAGKASIGVEESDIFVFVLPEVIGD